MPGTIGKYKDRNNVSSRTRKTYYRTESAYGRLPTLQRRIKQILPVQQYYSSHFSPSIISGSGGWIILALITAGYGCSEFASVIAR